MTVPTAQPLAGVDGWRLHGVFSSSQAAGWALLSLGEGGTISVRLGDSLPGGIQVKGVEPDLVWLQRGSEQALLYLQGAGVMARPESNESDTVLAEPLQPDALPAGCAPYAASGVPVEELITLGGCPSAVPDVVPQ